MESDRGVNGRTSAARRRETGVNGSGAAALAGSGRGMFAAPQRTHALLERSRAILANRSWGEALPVAAALALIAGFVHPLAYSAPTLRAVLETIMTLFALAAAAMMREQFLVTHRLRQLLMLAALVMLALSEFSANALPPALHVHSRIGYIAAFPVSQLIAALLLLAAARTSSDTVLTGLRRPVLVVVLLVIGSFAFAELVGLLLQSELLRGASSQPGIDVALVHPFGFALMLCTAGCYFWSAVEFSRRASRERSGVLLLAAQAALLLGVARLYYLALPWVSGNEITLREILRLLAFSFILIAVLRADHELRASATRAATFAERRRVARDLHDGLAQDLALIAAHGRKVVEELGEGHPLSQAVRHALAISRETIIDLSEQRSTSPRESLEAIAHELGDRFGTQVVVDVAPAVALTPDTRDQVSRIAREAIANAARHGGATHVLVSLKPLGAASVLRVVDDGSGIGRPSSQTSEGFGIRSMRERASALGGTFSVRPAGSRGTNLEVIFP